MLQPRPARWTPVTRWIYAGSAALLLLAPVTAGAAQQAESSGVTLKVNAPLTLVDVTVTDAQGHPVHGLTQADFTVKEDGKPQALKSFEEYGSARPAEQVALPELPPDVYTNAQPPAPSSGAVNILMFDNLTTGLAKGLVAAPGQVQYEQAQAMRYLNTMPAGTQVAIVELGNGLRVGQSFTSDRDLLVAAVRALVYTPVQGAYRVPHPYETIDEICNVLNAQSELVVNGLARAAAFLAGVKGRKNLIWFTPGTPWLTDYSRYSRIPCLRNFTPRLTGDYGLLTAEQTSLYPVDPRGVEGCFASMGAGGTPNGLAAAGVGCFNALPDEHASIDDMARATGGAAYYNQNDVTAAVHDAIATGTDYYALSYAPPSAKYDGKYHKINVRVDRPGVHLVYREGYMSLDPTAMAALATPEKGKDAAKSDAPKAMPKLGAFEMALGHGAAPSTELVFDVRVKASAIPGRAKLAESVSPELKGKQLVRYDFAFTLPSDQITLKADPGGTSKGTLELVIAAYDGDGKMLNFLSQTGEVGVKPGMLEQFLARPFEIPLQLDLPPGKIFVRMGVRDVPSGKIGAFEIPVTVAK